MPSDRVEVTVSAFPGRVPVFCAAVGHLAGAHEIFVYQREDGAWVPMFPADRPAVARPGRRGAIDLPAVISELFPELVR